MNDAEARRGGGALGVGGQLARGVQAVLRVEVAAAAHDAPAVVALVAHPLPDVAGELLGAARRRAVGVRAHRHRPAPARPRRSCSASGSNVWPHGHGRASSPRAAASHSAPVGSRAAEPTRRTPRASARVTSTTGWSASCGSATRGWSGRKRANAALVTGKRPIKTPATAHDVQRRRRLARRRLAPRRRSRRQCGTRWPRGRARPPPPHARRAPRAERYNRAAPAPSRSALAPRHGPRDARVSAACRRHRGHEPAMKLSQRWSLRRPGREAARGVWLPAEPARGTARVAIGNAMVHQRAAVPSCRRVRAVLLDALRGARAGRARVCVEAEIDAFAAGHGDRASSPITCATWTSSCAGTASARSGRLCTGATTSRRPSSSSSRPGDVAARRAAGVRRRPRDGRDAGPPARAARARVRRRADGARRRAARVGVGATRAARAPRLRELLELDFEHVLVSHGGAAAHPRGASSPRSSASRTGARGMTDQPVGAYRSPRARFPRRRVRWAHGRARAHARISPSGGRAWARPCWIP